MPFNANKNKTHFESIYEYIQDNYFYILNEEDLTIQSVINSAKAYIQQKGIKILVIDPYNKLEHQQERGQTETQYISKFLDILVNFARFNSILIFLVAHPTKMPKGEIPSLYNISGSANFYNKTDYGFTVDRAMDDDNIMTNNVNVYWQKIKFKHLGTQGVSELCYNINNGRFDEVGKYDNVNYLTSKYNVDVSFGLEFDESYLNEETYNDVPF